MHKQSRVIVINRREFARQLLGLGIGAAFVGYAEATPVPVSQTPAPQEMAKEYRLTPHIESYYQAARF